MKGGAALTVVSMKHLLEAGVHFGHQTRRWNPKMKPYIFTERNGIYIIDLQQSLELIKEAYNFVKEIVSEGQDILFVGTKKQAQEAIDEEAERCEMPYVSRRWLGGTLTNYQTISKRIEHLKELKRMEEEGELENLTKKERQRIKKQREKLEKNLGGIENMDRLPGAVFIVDPNRERIVVNEANRIEIPIVSIVDTNCDPDEIDYVISGNDDAIRSIALITRIIADAALEGLELRKAILLEKMEEIEAESKDISEEEAEELAKEKLIEENVQSD